MFYVGVEYQMCWYQSSIVVWLQCDSHMYTKYCVHFYNIGIYHPFLIFKKLYYKLTV
jgi:hypothetical protein